ncbi:hypothetical protein F4859DRAFT_495276 [Xylaria cf. heliscus]|nr:hypothetical protein F4859DRAFT_495276 [Xylaria cf. heliscus]
MNRLCQSSYGNLEAVINISGHDGNAQRKLVHFYRDRITGLWSDCAVVSCNPKSGGSMIQNISKHDINQEHGDFEVVVLEDYGALQHYTRDNTIPVDNGVYAWHLSSTITAAEGPTSPVAVINAAPLFQSRLSMHDSSDGTTLETVVIDNNRRAIHYRCAQYGASNNLTEHRHHWRQGEIITDLATGPACIYQTSPDTLMALVPRDGGVDQYSFKSNIWLKVGTVTTTNGPSCVYASLSEGTTAFHTLVCVDYQIHDHVHDTNWKWRVGKSPLPASMSRIRYTPYHKVLSTNPISVLSQSDNTLCQSPNTEAIVFHACGTGFKDSWMILHWTLLAATGKWIVCDVVLPHVIGMPL